MAFVDSVIETAWRQCGGRCECRRRSHIHLGNHCNKQLVERSRGRSGTGNWEARYRRGQGARAQNTLANCEIVCWSCFKGGQRR